MMDYDRIKEIVNLIVTEVREELTPEQQVKLNEWLNEDSQNAQLYSFIKNSNNFRNWEKKRDNLNIQDAWDNVVSEIQKDKKRVLLPTLVKYAAAIILPLLIAGGAYLYISKFEVENEVYATSNTINPGTSKAFLKLNNGEIVILDSLNNRIVTEKDGTIIQKNNNIINYSGASQKVKHSEEPIFNTIEIPRGGEFNIVLADGTHVFLNSMSTLKYPVQFTGETREVELTGEAYFEVAHDDKHPFIVNANEMQMKVLGTSFNINAYESANKIITTLVEGKLAVKTKDAISFETVLSPKEQAVLDLYTNEVSVNQVNVDFYTSWKDGKFIFYDTRLEDMMDVLTRWYSANVFFLNPSVKELRFSGNLNRYGEIEQILDIIEATNKVNVEINNKSIVFSEK